MDTNSPLNPASDQVDYKYVFVDHFSKYIPAVPTPNNVTHHTVNLRLHHWISKIGLP